MGDPEKEAKLFLSVNILRAYKPEDDERDLQLRQVYCFFSKFYNFLILFIYLYYRVEENLFFHFFL